MKLINCLTKYCDILLEYNYAIALDIVGLAINVLDTTIKVGSLTQSEVKNKLIEQIKTSEYCQLVNIEGGNYE